MSKSAFATKEEVIKIPSFYYDDELLIRLYRSPKLKGIDEWAEKHQIVVPQPLRRSILELSHDELSGHLGIFKTYHKILEHFYWPGLKQDVSSFIKTCHVCQVVGKVNQPIRPAPLQPIPVCSDPFERIIIDCVGPLPCTGKGHQYLLTVMCPTTRYPEAIPLRNIKAKTIVPHLLNLFTRVGIPIIIQSDQGSNFTSNLFSEILKELGIDQKLSSAYHPES